MSNDFYNPSGAPSTRSQGRSDTMRAEFLSLQAAFDKMPALTGNGSKLIAVNSGASALQAISTAAGVLTLLGAFTSANLAAALGDETGSGAAVFASGPTLVAPVLGTPASGTLTNCTGFPAASLAGLGAGVAAWLANPTSANLAAALTDETGTGANVFANSPTLVTPTLGTPASGTLTNCTGFPAASLAGLGAGVAAWLANPTSANLAAALTDETGSGAAVFATSPTLTTPNIGAATGTSLTVTGNIDTTSAELISRGAALSDVPGGNNKAAIAVINTTSAAIYKLRVNFSNNFVIDYFNGASWAQRWTLDSAGNVGIGITPSHLLHVSAANATISADRTASGAGKYALFNVKTANVVKWQWGLDVDFSDTAFSMYDGAAGTYAFSIATGGAFSISRALSVTSTASCSSLSESAATLTPGAGAGATVDWSKGGTQLTNNGTNALTFSNVPSGTAGHILRCTNFNNTTFPAAVTWGVGGKPSIAGEVIVSLVTYDGGTTVYGMVGWQAV